ncbi:YeeE/YedE family protein [Paraliomyxa miuraensis]|uniref:YeeE/YedE family protein n=1 Tax=Paraliomyxa miuraensis TaxID=376150 RepID=UPI0022522E19|nr:YeeE/YedE thiosulfate transporter family protein [Paraliomyxa miuraensis]MCX4243749.1 YeeE/YedE family protein [Paraliomyxa miuraensis]
MTDFTPVASALGGLLIGGASALLLAFSGRIAGISGIVGDLLAPSSNAERAWRAAFLAGLLLGGALLGAMLPAAIGATPVSLPVVIAAGLLVGFGSRLGAGCTSGHGICGLSRISARSLVATLTFMGTGMATVLVARHLG